MRNRILRLEQDDSPYLLGKAKGTYWSDIRLMLEHAPSQLLTTVIAIFLNSKLEITAPFGESSSFGDSNGGLRQLYRPGGHGSKGRQLLAEGEEREEALPTVEGQAKALAEG
ncbi:hypothetical protein Tco_0115687 [Tanacetum coccineum]